MKTKKEDKLIVGYIRSAVKNDLSVKKQEKQIKDYCLKHGHKLSKIFVDNGCSGANLERPEIQALLAEAVAGKISKVVCLDLSRLSRSTSDYLVIKSQLKKYGVEIVCTTGVACNEATSKTMNELIAVINSFQAQLKECKKGHSHKGK